MLKFFTAIFFILIASFIAVFAYVNMNGAQMASDYLSKMLGLPVTIEKIDLGWKDITVRHTSIEYFNDSTISSAFKADRITIDLPPLDLLRAVLPIQEINVENATIGIELENLTGSENNWEKILNTLFAYDKSTAHTKEPKKVIIDKLVVHNLVVQAKHELLGPYTIVLPAIPLIEVDNLTANTPITIAEALNITFRTILTPLSEQAAFKQILNEVEELPPSLKAIFSHQEIHEQLPSESHGWTKLREGLQEVFEDITSFLKNIFSSKEKHS